MPQILCVACFLTIFRLDWPNALLVILISDYGLLLEKTIILFENQIQTASTSPCRTQVQPAASFLVCSLIFIEYESTLINSFPVRGRRLLVSFLNWLKLSRLCPQLGASLACFHPSYDRLAHSTKFF